MGNCCCQIDKLPYSICMQSFLPESRNKRGFDTLVCNKRGCLTGMSRPAKLDSGKFSWHPVSHIFTAREPKGPGISDLGVAFCGTPPPSPAPPNGGFDSLVRGKVTLWNAKEETRRPAHANVRVLVEIFFHLYCLHLKYPLLKVTMEATCMH